MMTPARNQKNRLQGIERVVAKKFESVAMKSICAG